jgi:hypothetical protein
MVSAQEEPAATASEMTQEERAAMRAERRGAFAGMSEEERATALSERRRLREQRMQAARERFANMTDDERQAVRENRAAREGARRERLAGAGGRRGGFSARGGRRAGPGGPTRGEPPRD